MHLSIGARVGPFEIVAPIGEGGMGEVYRARDARLHRDVAIKVLRAAVARDPDRLARFDREAQVLASLNHPNIGALYGLEDAGDLRAIVMELVEGPTLADRIASGPIALDEALPIARAIAEALEAAHERGIVHRDLKPANIKVRPDGTVKVLDFGLAKALEPAGPDAAAEASITHSPTMVSPVAVTQHGFILGTAPYMSPEQAKGRPVDRRVDIWAFGCVLYEMLAGRRVFDGDEVSDVLASVIKSEPDWQRVPAATPQPIRRLLKRCLEKNPAQRLQAIGDARIEIDDVLGGEPDRLERVSAPRRRWLPPAAFAVAVVVLAGLGATMLSRWTTDGSARRPLAVTRSAIGVGPAEQLRSNGAAENLTEGRPVRTALALSPDGRLLVFSGLRGGRQQLWLRSLDRLEATPIAGTDNGARPFFSPDGRWLGFWADGALKKVALTGDSGATTICETEGTIGASWGSNGLIAFGTGGRGLSQVSAAGGTPRPLTQLDLSRHEVSHRLPQILPGNGAVIFTVTQSTIPKWEETEIVVESLTTGQRKTLTQGADARYVTTGHLVFVRGGVLLAAPFDLARLELTGGAVTVVPDVMQAAYMPNVSNDSGAAQFSVSASGSLAYVPGGVFPDLERSLVWIDRAGTAQPVGAPKRAYFAARLSPDGRQVLVWTSGRERNVWTYDIERGALSKVTTEGRNAYSLWTPDGKKVVFRAETGTENLFWIAADGSGPSERLTTSANSQVPDSLSPDGQTLLFVETSATTGDDIWALPLAGDRRPHVVVQTRFHEAFPELSPDGRWLAYTSNDSGSEEVYVQPYPGPGPRHLVSAGGGAFPGWSHDGKELFYQLRAPESDSNVFRMMAVTVMMQPTFSAGAPRMLWARPNPLPALGYRGYDVAADGRFLVVDGGTRAPIKVTEMILVENWFEELKRLVPTGK